MPENSKSTDKAKNDSVKEITKRVLDRLRKMTPEERVQSLVDAGIIREDGSLMPAYGG